MWCGFSCSGTDIGRTLVVTFMESRQLLVVPEAMVRDFVHCFLRPEPCIPY